MFRIYSRDSFHLYSKSLAKKCSENEVTSQVCAFNSAFCFAAVGEYEITKSISDLYRSVPHPKSLRNSLEGTIEKLTDKNSIEKRMFFKSSILSILLCIEENRVAHSDIEEEQLEEVASLINEWSILPTSSNQCRRKQIDGFLEEQLGSEVESVNPLLWITHPGREGLKYDLLCLSNFKTANDHNCMVFMFCFFHFLFQDSFNIPVIFFKVIIDYLSTFYNFNGVFGFEIM